MKDRGVFLSQVFHLTISNMKSRYRKTFAGFIWVAINPIMLYGAQSIAFRKFLRLEIPDFFTFLLSGLLPWIFIVQTLDMSTSLLVNNGHFLKAMKVHPLVVLLSQVLDNFINFMFAFIILLIPVWWGERNDPVGFIFLPLGLIVLILGVIAMCWFLSVINIFYRDTRFVVNFLTSVMFFMTPIFYPVHFMPEQYRWMAAVNPFYGLIQPVRTAIYHFEGEQFVHALGVGSLWASGFFLLAWLYWRKKHKMIYYNI